MTLLTEQFNELSMLIEGRTPRSVKKWFEQKLGIKSVRSGSGSTSRKIVLSGFFDEKTQTALRQLGFQVTGARMAMIDRNSASWLDLVKWIEMEGRRGHR
jgi:hypothetical protein